MDKGVDPRADDSEGKNALDMASLKGKREVLEMFKEE
jgi:hypothetical protein